MWGAEHPETLATASNLVIRLADVGRVGETRVLGEETLERRLRVLGEDHPETRRTATWLAELGAEQEEPSVGRVNPVPASLPLLLLPPHAEGGEGVASFGAYWL